MTHCTTGSDRRQQIMFLAAEVPGGALWPGGALYPDRPRRGRSGSVPRSVILRSPVPAGPQW